MNYKVLYRKYRPTNFDEIVGQNSTVSLLKDAVDSQKISHAYIFSGPRGTGKTSSAKIFAKAINCSCESAAKPCGNCENCQNFIHSNDVYEIDAASNNGVDQIREIIENIKLSPISSKYKVYIIDEVHMLSTSAFNALLLTLEEPPSHVVFILATTDIEDVPITVLSRCQRLDFRKISTKEISKKIEEIAKIENINIDANAINEIAEYADGGMRDALSILDQLSKYEVKITQDVVLSTIGSVSNKAINELIQAINDNKMDIIINFVNKVKETNADYKLLVKKLINNLKKRAIEEKMGAETSRLTYDDYKKICFELANTIYKNNVNIDSFSLLELILLDNISEKNVSKTELINKPEEKEEINRLSSSKIIETSHKKNNNDLKSLINARINNCFVNANKKYLVEAKKMWEEYKNIADDKKNITMIMDFDVVLSSDDIIVLKTDLKETAENFNIILAEFEESFANVANKNYKFISIDKTTWESEMEKYKNNIKNGVVYKYINEPIEDEFSEVTDIFISKKIEVQ